MSARILLLGAMLWAAGCDRPPSPPSTPPARPAPDEPRAKIRAELLKQTPPGSSADEVLRFIAKALPPRPGTPAPALEARPASGPAATTSGHPGTQRIRVVLGEYVVNPAFLLQDIPLAMEKQVTAQWAFDAGGRLLDVFVDKKTQLGD